MLTDQCVSVTDLRKHANIYIDTIKKPKFVFVNNQPKAVLLDIKMYEQLIETFEEFVFNPPVKPSKILSEYKKTYGKKIH